MLQAELYHVCPQGSTWLCPLQPHQVEDDDPWYKIAKVALATTLQGAQGLGTAHMCWGPRTGAGGRAQGLRAAHVGWGKRTGAGSWSKRSFRRFGTYLGG